MTNRISDYNNIEQQLITLNKQASSYRKASRLNPTVSMYFEMLSKYKHALGIDTYSTCFDNYVSFFALYKNKLVFSGNPAINLENPESAFHKLGLPTTEDCLLEKEILSLLKKILVASLTPCQKACNDYLIQNHLTITTTDFILYIQKHFHLINQQLFYVDIHNHNMFSLHEDNITDILSNFMQPLPKLPLLKRILKSAIKEGIIQTSKLELCPDKICPFLLCKYQTEYYSLSYTGKHFKINQHVEFSAFESEYYKANVYPFPQNHHASSELAHFLYYITKGNTITLNNFSHLLTAIVCPTYAPKYLFVITPSMKSTFDVLIETITHKESAPFIDSLKDLIAPSDIRCYANYHNTNYGFFFITNISYLHEDSDIKQLKKLISGKNIALKDSFIGKQSYTCSLPIICVPQSHQDIVYLKNNFNCIFLDMELEDLSFHLSQEDFDWLQNTFLLYGLKAKPILKKGNHAHMIPISHDTIIEDFINNCCYATENAHDFVYASDLYNTYLAFYKQNYSGTPLKRIQLVNIFKRLGFFEYKRPHINRNVPNAYAFTNLQLRKTNNTHQHTKSAESAFDQYIHEISASIPAEFWEQIDKMKESDMHISFYRSNE